MQSINRFIPDAANALRAADAAAITADTVISAGALVSPIGAIWNDAVKDGKVVLFFKTSDVFDDDGDELYSLEIITSTAEGLGSPQIHYTYPLLDGGEGAEDFWHEIIIDQHSLAKADPDAKYWGVNVNVAGTAPSLKIEMYLLPPVGM
jgi:hypothetical protein